MHEKDIFPPSSSLTFNIILSVKVSSNKNINLRNPFSKNMSGRDMKPNVAYLLSRETMQAKTQALSYPPK